MTRRKPGSEVGNEKAGALSRRRFVGVTAALAGTAVSRTMGMQELAATPVPEPAPRPTVITGSKAFSQFTRMPGGSIRPEGWLRRYAQTNADGWILKHA